MNLAIGILTGGKSRRMGTPKALLPIGGTTLLERTMEIARHISDDLLLLGQPFFDLPPSLKEVPIEPDRHPGIGPIAGLQSILLTRPKADCILLACDMPNLNGEILRRLVVSGGDFDAIVCATAAELSWHPCCALYRPTCLPIVHQAVAERRFGMMDLLGRLRVRTVELTGDEAAWVANWNEPKDLPDGARPPRPPC